MALMKVMSMNDAGQPEIKQVNINEASRIDEVIPVFSSSLSNWQFIRGSKDDRFHGYGKSSLEMALLCLSVILATIEREGTDEDKAELENFVKSFTQQ